MPTRRRIRPDSSTRALGLIRVSKERDGLLSPDIQRSAIEEYAAKVGHVVAGWAEGIDQSGSTARSAWWPTLERAVESVEAGEYDAVVVWKFSRTARNRLRWAVALDRVEAAGGTLESATEQFDTTTSSGRFARGMLAELNAFEAERIGEVWKEVHADRLGRGLTHNGRSRFGYVYADGLHVPDPETAPVLAELYRRFAAGESVYTLARDLNARAIPTSTGGLWTEKAVRRVLDSGFGAGLLYLEHRPGPGKRRTREPEHVDGAHTAVISELEWAAFLRARQSRRQVAPRSQRSPYLLSGLVRCAHCEGGMTGNPGPRGVPMYRCETVRATGGHGCQGGGYVSAGAVDDAVFDWLRDLADDVDQAAARADVAIAQARDTTGVDRDRLAREVARLDAALIRLTQQHAEDEASDEATFRAARDDYRTRIAAAQAAYDALGERVVRLTGSPAASAGPLVQEWGGLSVAERRDTLRTLVARVMVEKRSRGTAPGVEVVPLWSNSC